MVSEMVEAMVLGPDVSPSGTAAFSSRPARESRVTACAVASELPVYWTVQPSMIARRLVNGSTAMSDTLAVASGSESEMRTTVAVARRPVSSPDGVGIRMKELRPAAPEWTSRRLTSPLVRLPGVGRVQRVSPVFRSYAVAPSRRAESVSWRAHAEWETCCPVT